MFFGLMRKSGVGGGNTFTKSHAKMNAEKTVKFSDVAGADEEKAELQELVEFLKIRINLLSLAQEYRRVCFW